MKLKDQKTTLITKQDADRGWVLVDVENKIVGRAASKIADILRGKHRPSFTPNVDNGDFVIVINASKLRFSGNKAEQKIYYHHSGFPGGMKEVVAQDQLTKHPDRIITDAVWGMLPKNKLSRQLMTKLRVYADANHPHEAQNPTSVNI